ncbi:MAG TPA: PhzF family phenazine biosynthesis protein [Bryobacteraceae bacterium]|nr:PhzF family phenazine biosynthesis protein [Bryobacteraceae bacterium]
MKLALYQVDAFTDRVFGGNAAAVCPLESWIEDELMLKIAAENNLAETAFFVPDGDGYHLRWFTPSNEVELCGHATLASAYVLFNHLGFAGDQVRFRAIAGELNVKREGDLYALDFPSRPPTRIEPPAQLVEALGTEPDEFWKARDHVAVYADEQHVKALTPDMVKLQAFDMYALIVTAPGRDVDFVSRFFAPSHGIPEDPVTGSAHCTLIPFWAERLGKSSLRALQVSKRRGELFCELQGDRVKIAGRAALYLEGQISV